MFRDILEIIKASITRFFQSRLAAVGISVLVLFSILVSRLFDLQVVNGDQYNSDFIASIERVVRTPGARGNIYDAGGNLLAYNKLCYNVEIADNGAYSGDYNARNLMLRHLAQIFEKHNVSITNRFDIEIDASGNFVFTSASDAARRRFIANVYGISTSRLDTEERYSSHIQPEELFRIKVSDYAFDKIKDENGISIVVEDRLLLDMVKILYTMRQTAFKRYETTVIAKDVDDACIAELMENTSELKGVSIVESYTRKYNNAKYFSHIIGYTGAVRDEKQLAELQKTDSAYELTDIVGATGLEKTMELVLKGKKGEKNMYVDSYGQVIKVIGETAPEMGDNLYLTIDQNLQIGVYHLLEQQMASILGNKLVNKSSDEIETPERASDILIPVEDAYFQLINNNVLDLRHFGNEEAGYAEKKLYRAFRSHKKEVVDTIRNELTAFYSRPMNELSREYIAYMVYLYDYLASSDLKIIDTSAINQHSESYLGWKSDTISLREYLRSGISEGWVNLDSLQTKENESYQDSDTIYNRITALLFDHMEESLDFEKLICKYMIIDRSQMTGRLLCMALYEQGVLSKDKTGYYEELYAGNESTAFSFLRDRIFDVEITPAQLALDPCMGSVVITDVNTGDVKALVTYPGYDNNRINDPAYFSRCLNDLSLPLINSATQTNKAPGSTFKPITAVAILEENKMTETDLVNCTGVYKEVEPNIRCWLSIPGHGSLNVKQAIENSCNYCFATYGHMLSTTENHETGESDYSTNTGLAEIRKYAAMFGLDRESGIQIEEKEPKISDSDPERSAFGQGTHSFNNVQLARYTVALANNGTLFNLTLLDREEDQKGNVKQEFKAETIGTIDISESTWKNVHDGLRAIVTTGVAKSVFQGFKTVAVAGKTGTAEEVSTRGNHGYFISYAPYNNPEIAVNVTIPFSYSSGNSARLARAVYDYYYGVTDLPTIINSNARNIGIVNIVAD